eukprot:6100022-Ditylum_brightwellii.AAC.1
MEEEGFAKHHSFLSSFCNGSNIHWMIPFVVFFSAAVAGSVRGKEDGSSVVIIALVAPLVTVDETTVPILQVFFAAAVAGGCLVLLVSKLVSATVSRCKCGEEEEDSDGDDDGVVLDDCMECCFNARM